MRLTLVRDAVGRVGLDGGPASVTHHAARLRMLAVLANRLGLYDAADSMRHRLEAARQAPRAPAPRT